MNTPLSVRLAEARQRAGLTQVEAARAAGVSRATINNSENGRYAEPALRTLRALARVYSADLNVLIGSHGEDRSDPSEASPENDRAPIPSAATRG